MIITQQVNKFIFAGMTRSPPSSFPAGLNDCRIESSHSDISVSNDEEDKAQTLSITLRQGNTQELPWHYYHYSDRHSKREGVALIHCPTAAVFNSIDKKPPASECLSIPVIVLSNHFCTLSSLFIKGRQGKLFCRMTFLQYWTSSVQDELQAAYQVECVPVWVMSSVVALLLATDLFRTKTKPFLKLSYRIWMGFSKWNTTVFHSSTFSFC